MWFKQLTKDLNEGGDLNKSASRRPRLFGHSCVTASLGSVTDTLNRNWDWAYANEFPVAVEDPDLNKLRTISQEAIGRMRGRNFDWKAFWDSKPQWSFLKLTLD
jgi:hypothetical protein